jgi:L-fuconolactonase
MSGAGTGRRIDSHVHFWALARGDYGWLTPDLAVLYRDFDREDLAPLISAAGIDAIVLVQAAPSEAETQFLLDRAAQYDRVAGVVGWVDMAAGDAASRIDALAGNPRLKAIRPMIHDIPDIDWMLREELAPAFHALVAHDLAFDALVRPAHLGALRRLADCQPDLRMVIDHGAKPDIANDRFDDWAASMTGLARDTPAYCKLSGLVTEAGEDWTEDRLRRYADHLVAEFSPARLLWGSDWPVVTLAASYGTWWAAANRLLGGLDEAGRERVFGGSAAEFYRL